MTDKEKTPVLHELLAVTGDLKGIKQKILEETINTFTKKTALFEGRHRKLEMFDDARKQEELEEHTELSTTVGKKLDYTKEAVIRFWDAKLQKERGGQDARADVEVDGTVIAKDVPVYFLLELENELKDLRKVFTTIPTLPPNIKWEADQSQGEGVYKSVFSEVRNKTEKAYKSSVLYEATKEHKAQIREWTEDVPIGKWIEDRWSGAITPADKSALLGRVDKLIRAVKKARQRANATEVPKGLAIGDAVFTYLLSK